MTIERESMRYDVVIVGAGPAGLAAACRLKQLNPATSVCVLEKAATVGAHAISGAVLDSRALDELFPNWSQQGAPVTQPVTEDAFYLLRSATRALRWPAGLLPGTLHNQGHYLISLGALCRWLGDQAEALGVEIYPGFAAREILFEDGIVRGVITGDHGRDRDGNPRPGAFAPGIELHARWTLFGEGARGHLGRQLRDLYRLEHDADPPHHAIGMKELWEVPPERQQPGKVVHAIGWPLDWRTTGGAFLYHYGDSLVGVGLVIDLAYRNPYLSPFGEFQRLKHHPLFADTLSGGRRIGYGARAIAKGGYNSLPRMIFPGGALIGCDLGTLDVARNKGIHTAMKSGLLAAEAIAATTEDSTMLEAYPARLRDSWLHADLKRGRNFGPALHRFGTLVGGACNLLDQGIGGRLPTLHDRRADHDTLWEAGSAPRIDYPAPDGVLSFDKPSSVYLASTAHDEQQPDHLTLRDAAKPVSYNLPRYDEPAQRYCPAGVYEILVDAGTPRLQINAANCVHCKVCDIKDPAQNIVWITPEGGSGPNYADM